MRRSVFLVALAVAVCGPAVVHAQVVGVQITRTYTPIILQPKYIPPVYDPQMNAFNLYPMIAPSYQSTLNIYPQYPVTYSYFAMPVFPYPAPSPGIYSASYSSNVGFGPFRTRQSFGQFYYYP